MAAVLATAAAGIGTAVAGKAISGLGQKSGNDFQAAGFNTQDLYGAGNVTRQSSDALQQTANTGFDPSIGMYSALASGQGPNPAQQQFKQNINQINQQQAGQLASTKGLNPALAARLAAQNAASNDQNAAAAAATLQAQQQIAALQGLTGAVGAKAAAQNAAANANLGQEQIEAGSIENQNTANAGIANTNAQAQNAANSGLAANLGSAAGMIGGMLAKGGVVRPMYADGGVADNSSPDISSQLTIKPQLGANSGPKSTIGKVLSGAKFGSPPVSSNADGSANNMAQVSYQGMKEFGQGALNFGQALAKKVFGSNDQAAAMPTAQSDTGATSQQALGAADLPTPTQVPDNSTGSGTVPESGMYAAKGGKVPAMVSPGEVYLPPEKVKEVAKSPQKGSKALKEGEKIPGKAKKKGNSYANDIVPKTLDTGGIVLPRSVTQAKDAPKKAAEFVEKILAKQTMNKKRK